MLHAPTNVRGFTLVEIAIVIVVLGLLSAMMIGMTASLVTQQRYQTTRTRLAAIDAALVLFVSVNRRLPCPADGTQAASAGGDENASLAGTTRTCTGNQLNGVVPWRALGLASVDIEDGWGQRITYRVGPDLVHPYGMDFSFCDPAGSAAVPGTMPTDGRYCVTDTTLCAPASYTGCTSPSNALKGASRGVIVKNVAGTAVMDPRGTVGAAPDITCTLPSSGAAYVLVSHGPEGGGAYGSTGTLLSSSTAAGTAEAMNFANVTYAAPICSGTSALFLVDDTVTGLATTAHFDDIVSRPSILTVATRAQLGPRARS